mmetsp:Transcript_34341/g.33548  ORF Transcript_34341/g.33548 Transcript_34341/m.33548 type:complete len:144 (+) Transcript_34341:48-479(+)|eukprot:CAMPEP_0170551446 /NCGR_PEP_ID=MMETSP0211-20121228/9443_1 /TAXON_ID=311385 /ORGANISM="Pseudokeronopsis sp., Strain OXSARD2" /LENGTH=143 /DNA_ID=CAMNT_0010858613 /DNA_START=28 /DNA_END=459 /DNA_ORIENTATION=-
MGPKKDAKGGKGGKGGKDAKGKVDPKKAGAISNKKGGKPKKKSWTKVKIKDKINNACFIDAKAYDKVCKDAPRILALTVYAIMDKYKVNGAVARRILRDLAAKGLIKQVGEHNAHFTLYTGVQAKIAEKEQAAAEEGQKKKGK